MAWKIRLINPSEKGKAMKKGSKKRKASKSKRRSPRRRRTVTRRAKAGTAVATARVSNPRRKRRSNPAGGDFLKDLAPIGAGVFAASLAAGLARKIPGLSSLPAVGTSSGIAGEPWGIGQYAVAGAAAFFLPKYTGKFLDSGKFRSGILATMAFKAIGGLIGPRIAMLGADEGEMRVDEQNQTWLYSGGSWQAMQGLVERDALDGLETESPLDADDEYIDVEAQEMGSDDFTNLYRGASVY